MSTLYTDITKGIRIPTQIPLDFKTWVAQKSQITTLGPGDNLAYTYYDGLAIYCADTKEHFIWQEALTLGGLIASDFTYPANTIINGFDYSGKSYNLFLIDYSGIDEANLVHKTGTETINGDKTFTGNTTFNNTIAISGNVLADSFISSNQITGNEFLKADGSLDSNTYSIDSNTVHLSGTESITGAKTFTQPITANSFVKSGGTNVQILAANGSIITAGTNVTISGGVISATGGIDATAVHQTGNETITGTKTFNDTSAATNIIINNSTNSFGIDIQNTNTGQAIHLNNNGSGYGIYLDNNSAGVGITLTNYNLGTGVYLTNFNTANGDCVIIDNSTANGSGINLLNNASGDGINLSNNSSGNGIHIIGNSSGDGIFIENNGSLASAINIVHSGGSDAGIRLTSDNGGQGINVTNLTGGHCVVANQGPSSSGFVFVGQNNGANSFTVDKLGNTVVQSLNIKGLNSAPPTATSTGTTGETRWTSGFLYLCVAPNTWQRVALSTF